MLKFLYSPQYFDSFLVQQLSINFMIFSKVSHLHGTRLLCQHSMVIFQGVEKINTQKFSEGKKS